MNKPIYRKLRGYALDPSLSGNTATAVINQVTYKVLWEDNLEPGPRGEYVEVIDDDARGNQICPPLNLSNPLLIAQDGLAPSEGNLQFHHQMLYAVAMMTIKTFEKGLGRAIQWCQEFDIKYRQRFLKTVKTPSLPPVGFQQRLVLRPHAMQEMNAYFSPETNSLIFGFFRSAPAEVTLQMPDSIVFSCLSHDVIAHEITHAIINGLYRNYTDSTNPDVFAFHEGISDVIAIFQHFSFPELIRDQIGKTRGDIRSQNIMLDMAHQFGTAIGNHKALRSLSSVFGEEDPETKDWKKKKPNSNEYNTINDPHNRGQILVAAIYETLNTVYNNQIADLVRIASGGSGVLRKGALHPDLVDNLADQASATAKHILKICIRALDYCPPTDITYGDYLRAIITSDMDMVEEDLKGYRIAFIEAFRERGVYPDGLSNLSEDSLRYVRLDDEGKIRALMKDIVVFLKGYRKEITLAKNRKDIHTTTQKYIYGNGKEIIGLYERIVKNKEFRSKLFSSLTGLVFGKAWKSLGIKTWKMFGIPGPAFDIRTLHFASRVNAEGKQTNQIILSLLQQCKMRKVIKSGDTFTFEPVTSTTEKKNVIMLTGGCTMVFDLDSLALKYIISKPLIDLRALKKGRYQINMYRAKMQHKYQSDYN